MRILIDADGCPVVNIAVSVAKNYGIEILLLCDTSHEFNIKGVKTITVSKGADSVDFALVNMLKPYDIVITQDYGLAAMCLAKRALPISQDGMRYTKDNIDSLLLFRHTAKKIRNAGGRLKGNSKRSEMQNEKFKEQFIKLINEMKDL